MTVDPSRCRCGATHHDQLGAAECGYTYAAQARAGELGESYGVTPADARDLWAHLRTIEVGSGTLAIRSVETILALGWRPGVAS